MKLTHWRIVETLPPGAYVLHGTVFSHPWFRDGERIHTSTIVKFSKGHIAHTKSGSQYELGEYDPDFEGDGFREKLLSGLLPGIEVED